LLPNALCRSKRLARDSELCGVRTQSGVVANRSATAVHSRRALTLGSAPRHAARPGRSAGHRGCILKNNDRHGSEPCKRDWSCANVKNFDSPLCARDFRSASTSRCQSGEAKSPALRHRASQSCSMAWSRCVTDIFSICDASSIELSYQFGSIGTSYVQAHSESQH
jgi:hypothetical protein